MTGERLRPGPQGHGILSNNGRAVRWRAQRDRENAQWRAENGRQLPGALPPDYRKGETIGVFKDPSPENVAPPVPAPPAPPAPAPEIDVIEYFCMTCKTDLVKWQAKCTGCELDIDWTTLKT